MAKVFHLLSHANRLSILQELMLNEEANVAELTERLKTSQANVSKHLKLLKEGEIISSRRSGNKTYYCQSQADPLGQKLNQWQK